MEQSAEIAAVFDAHMAAEFAQRDLDATMATMGDDPYVYHVPVMTGGVGFEDVRRSYGQHFIGKWRADTRITPISRTVGQDQVVRHRYWSRSGCSIPTTCRSPGWSRPRTCSIPRARPMNELMIRRAQRPS